MVIFGSVSDRGCSLIDHCEGLCIQIGLYIRIVVICFAMTDSIYQFMFVYLGVRL